MRSNDLIEKQQTTTTWNQIECVIRENLEQFESGRKFCAYCGQKEEASSDHATRLILGRCYGCQMVYYCSQEHQHSDWLEHHMPKCAELEWVALGELIQSIPANPALTNIGMYWPDNYMPHTWTDWFEIRPDLVQIAKQTASVLEQNQQVKLILNKFNRREPSSTDLIDGLLAAVTDSITYALTIGNCLIKTGINPNLKPVCIHLLHPPSELIDDDFLLTCLDSNELIEQTEIDRAVKKKFYELCNMFPLNKGIEIVFISTSSDLKRGNNSVVLDWSKLLKAPFMKTQLHKSLPLTDKNLYISAWQGSYSNYIKYACQIEGYSHPDLVVSFHPGFTSSPHKLINDWTDDLKIILMNDFPCLFTFYDREEKQKAFNILNAFQSNFLCAQSNQFSSLMLKQMQAKPNHVYASNSFLIVIKGFINCESDSRYQHQANLGIINETSSTTSSIIPGVKDVKRSKSIHDLISNHNHQRHLLSEQSVYQSVFQNDACIQTLGVEEPENVSLRHINGKLQINKSSIYSKQINSETLIKMSTENSNLPLLDFSAKTNHYYQQQFIENDNDLKVNFRPSNFLNKNHYSITNQIYLSHFKHTEPNDYEQNRYYKPVGSIQISTTPMVQTRSRSRPLHCNNSPMNTTSIAVLPQEEQHSQPPPLKPRVINNSINNSDILDINTIPTTKPRMRPTRIYDKYTTGLQTNQEQINPLPKPRNSIHLNDIKTETNNEELKATEEPLSFKANLLKKSKEQKEADEQIKTEVFLQMSPTSSTSSSPCSSTSALSMSSSPRSTEDQAATNSSSSSSTTSSSSSSSQAIMSSSSISSFNSACKTNSGFVNQMKNIFESQQQQIDLKKKQTIHERDVYEVNTAIKKPPTSVGTLMMPEVEESQPVDKEEKEQIVQEPQSEYMNVSNKYLNFLKLKQSETNQRHSPPSTPPPLPPSSPPVSRSPSPQQQNNEFVSLLSSPFKPTNDKLVSKIISTPITTTLTTTTTTTTTTISSAINPSNKQLSTSTRSSSRSSNQQTPIKMPKSEFRILNNGSVLTHSDRSATTLSGKSLSSLSQSNNNLNFNNRVMLTHIPDSVDLVQFQYEGQRRVVVPGYMTSADLLRNMLLNSNNLETSGVDVLDPAKAPIIIQRQTTTTMSLKEKLLLQNRENNHDYQQYNQQKPPQPPPQTYQQQQPQIHQQPTQIYQKQPSPQIHQQQQQQTKIYQQQPQSIKPKQIDDDEELDKKFARGRTRSMSGIVTMDLGAVQTTQIIDIDLDYESNDTVDTSQQEQEIHTQVKPSQQAPISSLVQIPQNNYSLNDNHYAVSKSNNREIKPSIRINQLISNTTNPVNSSIKSGSSRRIPSHNHRQSVTGSFDPNDFDSFDEEENNSYLANNSNMGSMLNENVNDCTMRVKRINPQVSHIQIESMEKIRESAILQQKLEEEREKQQMNLVQFDPDDFDSFNEDEDEIETKQTLPVVHLNNDFNEEDHYLSNDTKEKRQTDFLNNRNKLEAIFKKNEEIYSSKIEVQPKHAPVVREEAPVIIQDLDKIEQVTGSQYESNQCNTKQGGGFFRSALDRISSRNSKSKSSIKTRSSSVPLRTLISSNLELSVENQLEQKPPPPQPQQRSKLTEASMTPNKKGSETNVVPNMKTLQLMNKMQSEYDEKQKRRKLRREQKNLEEKLPPKSPKSSSTDRKFLSSIMNTLFSSSTNVNDSTSSSNNESKSTLQKNEAKRLSLRKLKAKDKAKKKQDSGDEMPDKEMSSNRSLNLIGKQQNYDEDDDEEDEVIKKVPFPRSSSFDTGSLSKLTSLPFQPNSIGTTSINSRFGKIKNETDKPKNENNKENLMKQLKAELDEEIKDRIMIELKHNIINGTCGNSTGGSTSSASSSSSNGQMSLNRKSLKDSMRNQDESIQNNRKIRSKSVTFLDEISTDDEVISMSNSPQMSSNSNYAQSTPNEPHLHYSTPQAQHRSNYQYNDENSSFCTPASSRKTKTNVKTGDVRMMCGALTGVGPIRSIMKKSATDLSLTLNTMSTSSKSNSYETNNNMNQLPMIQLGEYDDYEANNNSYLKQKQYQQNSRMIKSETQPNITTKRRDLMQSDL